MRLMVGLPPCSLLQCHRSHKAAAPCQGTGWPGFPRPTPWMHSSRGDTLLACACACAFTLQAGPAIYTRMGPPECWTCREGCARCAASWVSQAGARKPPPGHDECGLGIMGGCDSLGYKLGVLQLPSTMCMIESATEGQKVQVTSRGRHEGTKAR